MALLARPVHLKVGDRTFDAELPREGCTERHAESCRERSRNQGCSDMMSTWKELEGVRYIHSKAL